MKSITNRMIDGLLTLIASFLALAPMSTHAAEDIEFKQVTATVTNAPARGPYLVGSEGEWTHKFPRPELSAATRKPLPVDDDQGEAHVGFRAAGAPVSEELGESAHVATAGAASPISTKTWKVDPKAGLGVRDLDIAASSNHLLLGTFSTIAVFKKDGTFLRSVQLTDLLQSVIVDINKTVKDPDSPSGALVGNTGFAVDQFFDTRLAFDTYRNRFWILSIARNSNSKGSEANRKHGVRLTVAAVSKTANPTGGWYAYWWDEDTLMGGNRLGHDYPTFGVSEQLMVARMHSHFLVARADKLAQGNTSGGVLTGLPDDSGQAFPAMQYGEAPSGVHFAPGLLTSKALRVWAIDPKNLAQVYSAEVPILITSYEDLADQKAHPDVTSPPQITTGVGVSRVMKSVYRDGRLYAVWPNARRWSDSEGPLAAIHVARVDVSHFPHFVPTGPGSGTMDRVFGKASVQDSPGARFAYYWPSLDVNRDGTIGIGHCRSGKTAFVEARFSSYRETDAEPRQLLLHKGEHPLTRADAGGEFGVLDYTGVAVDPADGRTFWVLQPYVERTGPKTGDYTLLVSKVVVPVADCKQHFHTGINKIALAGLTEEEAREAARKKWEDEVAAHDGSAWSNWSFATERTASCSQKGATPKPPQSDTPTTHLECVAKAKPCGQ
jgi:hypothetical protein